MTPKKYHFRYSHQEVFVRFLLQTSDIRQRITTLGAVLFDLKFLETLETRGSILDVWRDILPEGIVSITE